MNQLSQSITCKYRLPFKGPTRVNALRTGDYSLEGYQDQIAIERKSIDDLVVCLGKERDRFEYFAVVVEGSFADLATGN